MRSPESVGNASFIVILPLTFVADTFVPSDTLPGPLRVVVEWNPVSSVTRAARQLFGNVDPSATAVVPDAWPLQHPVVATLQWVVVVLAVFVPLVGAPVRAVGDPLIAQRPGSRPCSSRKALTSPMTSSPWSSAGSL